MGWLERRCPCGSKTGAGCKCPKDRVRWLAGLRVNGRKVTRTEWTKAEAQAWLADQVSAVNHGTFVDPRGGDRLFADWAETWWAGRDALGAPGSRKANRSRLDNHLLPAFGHRSLGDIHQSDVQKWVNGLTKKLSPRTVRHCHALLYQIFCAAIDEPLVTKNPCRSPSGRGTQLPKPPRTEAVALDGEQIRGLIECLPPHWRPFVGFVAATGVRYSEAAGLRVRYLDLVGGEVRIRKTYSEHAGWQDTPKTDASWRTVTIPRRLAESLAPLCEGKELDDAVFTTPTGRLMHHGNWVSRVWEPAVERAGLAGLHPTPHDLRHSHASLLAEHGLSAAAQSRLGHSTASMTGHYTHARRGADDAALAIIELEVLGVPDTPPDA